MAYYTPWILFHLLIAALLAVDLLVVHRKAHKVSMAESVKWSIIWIAIALGFNVLIFATEGSEAGLQFLTGYLVEKSLSVDNLFVFLVIFRFFATPKELLHTVLFYGIVGAILMRGVFILVGITLVSAFHWMLLLFGVFLVYSGLRIGLQKEKEIDLEKSFVMCALRRIMPIVERYEGNHFFVREKGKLAATLLFVVLICVEATDVVFALDSIPAILAITLDPFIAYTSNIFAILGLRALFFALSNFIESMEELHYGLAALLVAIGMKMLISPFFKVPTFVTFLLVVVILGTTVLISLWRSRRSAP